MKKICCVFNHNPFYRFPIYSRLNEAFDCDFYFGTSGTAKPFEPSLLKGFKHKLRSKRIYRSFIWDSDIKDIFSSKYKTFLLTGAPDYIVNWLILVYAKLTGKKVYFWTHGINKTVKGFKSKCISKAFYKPADGIFLYGSYAIPFMEEIGVNREKLHAIHNSLDTDIQTRIYETISYSDVFENYFHNSDPVVIYIGRLQKRKKISQLLDAVSICLKKSLPLNLVVVGKEMDDFSLKKYVDEIGIEGRVWFYGECYNELETANLIYNSSVCVCPAAVGLTCIHSLSYGTPVVSNNDFESQMPEFEAIIPGVTGSFFEKDNVEDLAKNIERWCYVSEKERKETRRCARETIEKEWSVDYQINLLKSILK